LIDLEKYIVSRLAKSHDITTFNCGVNQIDSYLKLYALANQEHGLGQTWVLHEKTNEIVIGYYTISTTHIQKIDFPSTYTQNYPGYPIPCALIGKLGVSTINKKSGFGRFLLFDSLKRIKILSNSIGINAVILHAINEDVAKFYEQFGFERFTSIPPTISMYLPINRIPD